MIDSDFFKNLFGSQQKNFVVTGNFSENYTTIGGAIADSGMLISNVLTQLNYAEKGFSNNTTRGINIVIKILRDILTVPVKQINSKSKNETILISTAYGVTVLCDLITGLLITPAYSKYNKTFKPQIKTQKFNFETTDIIGVLKNAVVGTIILAYDISEKKKPSESIRNILSSYGSVVNGVAGSVDAIRVQIVSALLVLAGSCDGLFSSIDGTSDNNVNTGG
jgi:hypothetical protein